MHYVDKLRGEGQPLLEQRDGEEGEGVEEGEDEDGLLGERWGVGLRGCGCVRGMRGCYCVRLKGLRGRIEGAVVDEVEEDGGEVGLRGCERGWGRGDAHEGLEGEAELAGGEVVREDGEEGVDVEGEVFRGGVGALGRREHGQHDAVGRLKDGEQVAVAAGGNIGRCCCDEQLFVRLWGEDEGEVLRRVEEVEVEAAVEGVPGNLAERQGLD